MDRVEHHGLESFGGGLYNRGMDQLPPSEKHDNDINMDPSVWIDPFHSGDLVLQLHWLLMSKAISRRHAKVLASVLWCAVRMRPMNFRFLFVVGGIAAGVGLSVSAIRPVVRKPDGATITWQLQVGHGHALLSNMPKVVDFAIGGWQYSAVTRFYSGRLLMFNTSYVVDGNPKLASFMI